MTFERSADWDDVNRVLHEFLIRRGWQLDEGTGDPCWTYLHAYGGKDIALKHDDLDYPDLADFGPLRPAIYLDESCITVYTHGTWKGCDAHRESRRSFRIRDAMRKLDAMIADMERASANVDPEPLTDCLLNGPCGEWFRAWRDGRGGSWSDATRARR